jgi:hypothetical protein
MFTTSCPTFAISRIVAPAAVLPHSSLLISLKKKKKEGEEGKESEQNTHHESRPFCHQSRELPIFHAISFRALPSAIDGKRWRTKTL